MKNLKKTWSLIIVCGISIIISFGIFYEPEPKLTQTVSILNDSEYHIQATIDENRIESFTIYIDGQYLEDVRFKDIGANPLYSLKTECGSYQTFDYGLYSYIDSIKCIRFNEAKKAMTNLKRLKKPCK